MKLWERGLVVVTGKGGVGKSTVAAAIAIAASRAGRRAAVVELYGQSKVASTFGLDGRSYAERPLAGDVDVMSLTPYEALDDFGHRKLKMDAIVRLLFKNRVMTSFIDAVPGLHDLLQLGKIENLLNEPTGSDPHYDLIVVDAPSTGHGVTLLASARTMSEMSRVGPFHDLARIIERQLADTKRTAVVVVTLPEDLPVHETLELLDQLGDERALVAAVVVNGVRADDFPTGPAWDTAREALAASPDPDVRELLRLADGQVERQALERAALDRLDQGVAATLGRRVPIAALGRVAPHDVAPADIDALAVALRDQLERE